VTASHHLWAIRYAGSTDNVFRLQDDRKIVAASANILVMLSDSFLRPILLVRGAPVPMLVIYWGRHFIPRV
jgi:hypothetical protein